MEFYLLCAKEEVLLFSPWVLDVHPPSLSFVFVFFVFLIYRLVSFIARSDHQILINYLVLIFIIIVLIIIIDSCS